MLELFWALIWFGEVMKENKDFIITKKMKANQIGIWTLEDFARATSTEELTSIIQHTVWITEANPS